MRSKCQQGFPWVSLLFDSAGLRATSLVGDCRVGHASLYGAGAPSLAEEGGRVSGQASSWESAISWSLSGVPLSAA